MSRNFLISIELELEVFLVTLWVKRATGNSKQLLDRGSRGTFSQDAFFSFFFTPFLNFKGTFTAGG